MTRVLLTGASGFAGSHVLEHILTNTEWDVVCIASWKHKGTPERIEEILKGDPGSFLDESNNIHKAWSQRITVITHDLESPFTEMTMKRIGEITYILNLASDSHVDRSITDPVPFVQNNVNIALNLLEYARVVKPKIFVQFSTDEVYGAATDGVNFAEWSPIIPSNPYSASKACQEAIAISYWRTYNVPVVITNTMNLFGQMQDAEKYIAKLIRCIEHDTVVTIHGDPVTKETGSRFYLHARNMADALLFILELPVPLYPDTDRPARYNIVGDVEMNNKELARTVAEILGKPNFSYVIEDFHKTRPGHDRRYALDGTKMHELGWNAPLTFRTSLEQYIAWTRKHKLWL
jgi:dTDP-glucose 4,6-dehydratase